MKKINHNIAIRLSGISKRYTIHHEKPTLVERLAKGKDEEFWALKDINLTIKKGERVGVIGPNGSGKTTLLKIIAGITTPTSGTVETHGRVVSLIDLEAGFHPDLTGEQNIYLNAMLLGMKKEEIDGKLKKIIAFADIGRFIDAPLFTYSSGMKLRLGFAIAIHSRPDIILIDEIIAVGDSDFRIKCLRYIDLLKRDKTIIISSHDLDLIHKICDTTINMQKGELQNEQNQTLITFLQQMPIHNQYIVEAKSNSMHPLIKRGDSVTIEKIEFIHVKSNDVIAFTLPNLPEIIVHRVIDTVISDREKTCITKGDSGFKLDSWKIQKNNYLGKVIKVGRKNI